jgi:L-lysine 2,3-aminomutase
MREAERVSQLYNFRVPDFYVSNVLTGHAGDPLIDIVLPSTQELEDGDEQWDSTPSPYRASHSPFWIQKYEYQGLIRLTTTCSGLCRFCYLKKKNAVTAVMRANDIDSLFDDLEQHGQKLQEIILSGGDPLCAPASTLEQLGLRMARLRSLLGTSSPYVNVHTREPVWDPVRLMTSQRLRQALALIQPKTILLNVLHPREVTPEFVEACAWLADAGGTHRPALLCQHPLFRGVNDSVEILEELYEKLLAVSPPVLPYYMVHPFYNGTLPKHKLTVKESQNLYKQLIRRPGCMTPRLVVPTPWGKCVIGPHEELHLVGDAYQLTTKDGVKVLVQ